jgi:hypothetical protein
VSWRRSLVAPALADMLKAAQTETDTASIFAAPPETLNPPAIVVGRPIEVRYSVFAFGIDETDLPIVCVGPFYAGEDIVDGLVAFVCGAVMGDRSINGTVASCTASSSRNWRGVRIGGADMLAADVVLTVTM